MWLSCDAHVCDWKSTVLWLSCDCHRLVEEHTKTLERVNELWKQKWPVHWDEVPTHSPLTLTPLTHHTLHTHVHTPVDILSQNSHYPVPGHTHTHPLHSFTHTQAWEEKHVTISLDSGGVAGFSVVGGRDQPQLPNPGAFIVTSVNQGGPAEGQLKLVGLSVYSVWLLDPHTPTPTPTHTH